MNRKTYYTDEVYSLARIIEQMTGKTTVPTNVRPEYYDFMIDGSPLSVRQDKAKGILDGEGETRGRLARFLVATGFSVVGDTHDEEE